MSAVLSVLYISTISHSFIHSIYFKSLATNYVHYQLVYEKLVGGTVRKDKKVIRESKAMAKIVNSHRNGLKTGH